MLWRCLASLSFSSVFTESFLIGASVNRPTRSLSSVKMSAEGTESSDIVICGGGIIGASIAYYMTKKGLTPIIVERSHVAAAASGKSGGFLAGGWGNGPTVQLHETSFKLHEELAKDLHVESFRKLPTLNVKGARRKGENKASWLDGDATSSLMDADTAQVTPLELTHKLMDAAIAAGAQLRIGTVQSVDTTEIANGNRRVTSVTLADGDVISCSRAVVAMGPWSVLAQDWFGMSVPMQGVKSTSLVYDGTEAVKNEPFALFCAEDKNGCHLEVYPRPNGEIYVCGIGGSDYVSGDRLRAGGDCESPEMIKADDKRVAAASRSLKSMMSFADTAPVVSQACMRPCPSDSLPMIGAVPGIEGAYCNFGHNCWGILWAPVSGLAMAELVAEGEAKCVNLSAFSPGRFMSRADKRGRKRGTELVGEQW